METEWVRETRCELVQNLILMQVNMERVTRGKHLAELYVLIHESLRRLAKARTKVELIIAEKATTAAMRETAQVVAKKGE